MHADLVRATGLELGVEQRQRRIGVRPRRASAGTSCARARPSAVDAHAALAVAGHVARRATARRCAARRATCRAPARDSACRSRRRAAARAAPSARARFLATSSTPDVSRSSRCTSSRNVASGRAWRSRSMTPNEIPLPPWTASPAGLSSAISASSSYRIGGSAIRRERGRGRACCAGAAARIGGIRRSSPGGEPGVGPDPPLVDPDLAAAQDPVDVALGDAFQHLDEVIVDPLAVAVLAHYKPIHSILA